MKNLVCLSLISGFMLIQADIAAQTDSIRLICPFENGSGREPEEAYTWDPPEKKIIMITGNDTIIRSCANARVSNVNPTEDNRYEVVIYYKDYYFWYYGVGKPFVKRGDTVKAGQPLGLYTPGTEVEFRMFKNEDAIDPRNLLDCRNPKTN
jgi:hypothetical protein